jgi:phosphohistidine phosphatase
LKKLIVLRHAKAENMAPDGTDIHRPLSERGHRDAMITGKSLRKMEILPDLVLCSPATRTRQTTEGLLQKLKCHPPVQFVESIYEASVSQLIDLLAQQQEPETILLVGHNPGVEELVSQLIAPSAPPHLRLPTAGIARIDFAINQWSELPSATGELVWLASPDLLRPLL